MIFLKRRKEESWKYFSLRAKDVLTKGMRAVPERTVFTVVRLDGAWAVEHGDEVFGHASDKEVAKAWAHKRAREIVDRGGAVQVLVSGESVLVR